MIWAVMLKKIQQLQTQSSKSLWKSLDGLIFFLSDSVVFGTIYFLDFHSVGFSVPSYSNLY